MLEARPILFLIGVSSWFVTLIVTPAVIRTALARDLIDAPGERKVHSNPVPRLGGVAVFFGTCVGLIAGASLSGSIGSFVSRPLMGACLGGTLMFAAGLADDVYGLTPRTKLALQLAAGTVAFLVGVRIEALEVGGFGTIALGWLAFPVTVFWIVAVTNAVNLIDGLDGLASGIGVVALTAMLIGAVALERYEAALFAVALASALIGFLRYNLNPARIFLGDSGSLFLGYSLAVLSIHGAQRSAATVLVLLPLSALALPLLDTTLAIARRWLRGMAFSEADARHIHHRLLALGLTQRRAVVVLCISAALVAGLGVAATLVPGFATRRILPPLVWIVFPTLVVAGVHRLDYHEFAHAVAVLTASLRRLRRVIRERIVVSELAQSLRGARSSEEFDAVLARGCDALHLRAIEVGRPGEADVAPDTTAPAVRLVRLEYPLAAPATAEPMVLRIWCDVRRNRTLANAERIAVILAPAVETWIRANDPHTARSVFVGSLADPTHPDVNASTATVGPLP